MELRPFDKLCYSHKRALQNSEEKTETDHYWGLSRRKKKQFLTDQIVLASSYIH